MSKVTFYEVADAKSSPYALLELFDAKFAAFNADYLSAMDFVQSAINALSAINSLSDEGFEANIDATLSQINAGLGFVSSVAQREKDIIQTQKDLANALGASLSNEPASVISKTFNDKVIAEFKDNKITADNANLLVANDAIKAAAGAKIAALAKSNEALAKASSQAASKADADVSKAEASLEQKAASEASTKVMDKTAQLAKLQDEKASQAELDKAQSELQTAQDAAKSLDKAAAKAELDELKAKAEAVNKTAAAADDKGLDDAIAKAEQNPDDANKDANKSDAPAADSAASGDDSAASGDDDEEDAPAPQEPKDGKLVAKEGDTATKLSDEKVKAVIEGKDGLKLVDEKDNELGTLKMISFADAANFLKDDAQKKAAGLTAESGKAKLIMFTPNAEGLKKANETAWGNATLTNKALVGIKTDATMDDFAKVLLENKDLKGLSAQLSGTGKLDALSLELMSGDKAAKLVTMFDPSGDLKPGLIGGFAIKGLKGDYKASDLLGTDGVDKLVKLAASTEAKDSKFTLNTDSATIGTFKVTDGQKIDFAGDESINNGALKGLAVTNVEFQPAGAVSGIKGLAGLNSYGASVGKLFSVFSGTGVKIKDMTLEKSGSDYKLTLDSATITSNTEALKLAGEYNFDLKIGTNAKKEGLSTSTIKFAKADIKVSTFSPTQEQQPKEIKSGDTKIASASKAEKGVITVTLQDSHKLDEALKAMQADEAFKTANTVYVAKGSDNKDAYAVYTGAKDTADDDVVVHLSGTITNAHATCSDNTVTLAFADSAQN